MNEPWFDPQAYAWIPGTVFGTLGGVMGAVAGNLAPKGRAKSFVLGAWWAFIAVGVLFLVIGVVALFSGQPYGIWYGFGLPGCLGTILFSVLLPVIKARYREAETLMTRTSSGTLSSD
jgi:hypothetical protein